MESQASPAERGSAAGFGLTRRPGERWSRFATRVANAFGVVLLLVVAIYVLASLLSYSGWGGAALAAVTSACATVALVSAESGHRLIRGSAALGAVAVALAVVSALGGGGGGVLGASALISALLLATAAGKILGAVLSEHEVGFRTILGAISVYVLLGILFTYVYIAVDKLQPGLFFGQQIKTGDFIFFSITTLSTTGYGNLVPAAQPGKMLSGLEMLTGQIFLVTLIAGLVSLWRPGALSPKR
jgi:Ion channel